MDSTAKKDAHRHRRARGEAVHAVGEVHGVDRADDDEGGEDHIQRLGDRNGRVPERDVETVERDISEAAHEKNERHGRRQLQQDLLAGRQTEILLLLELFIVVQKADRAEHERERQAKTGGRIRPRPCNQSRPTGTRPRSRR